MHRGRWCQTALLILLFSWPNIAVCEEKPLWELGAGLVLLQMPDYFGSDKNRLYLLPYPYFIYRGDILDIDRDRISGRVFKTDRILLDLSFFGQVPVESSDNEARQGMPDLDPTFEVGPSLKITLLDNRQDHQKLYLFLPVRAVFSTDFSSLRHEGLGIRSPIGFRKKRPLSLTPVSIWMSLPDRPLPTAPTIVITIPSNPPMPPPRVPPIRQEADTAGPR